MPLPRRITIDGPAGSGKSSVSFAIARDLGYVFVDTGAFYRAVTLAALEAGLVDATEHKIVELAQRVVITVTADLDADGRQYTVLLDGRDVTWALRTPAVEANVSRISAMPSVREVINIQQRAVAERNPVIMVGRDIGTTVLPDADLKLYLDASLEVRAARRYQQAVANGLTAQLDAIRLDLQARDAYDSGRETSPLQQASDAIYVSTDDMTIAEAIVHIERIITGWEAQSAESPA
ncbi:MAG: (d)CMP kinase [Aggregatilineales bacterium]